MFKSNNLTARIFQRQILSPHPGTSLISATDRHRQATKHPIKFISRRQPNVLKFKIKPGSEAGAQDGSKRISSFL